MFTKPMLIPYRGRRACEPRRGDRRVRPLAWCAVEYQADAVTGGKIFTPDLSRGAHGEIFLGSVTQIVFAVFCGVRETAQDGEGQGLRIVHGAGRGIGWLIALVAAWRKASQSFGVAQDSGFASMKAFG